jgi:diguanylate cyclase (GGDEF)-like protein
MVMVWISLLGSYVSGLRSRLAAALGRLKELATRDELTGLYNRRHLMDTLDQQQERSKRYGEPFALCIIDIDHFKSINDSHGHGVGDEVLRAFAERIRSQLRKMDIIGRDDADNTFGRYGGEEFLLLLPYAVGSSPAACLNRLRSGVAAAPFVTSAGELSVTFSAGFAQHRPDESNALLISRADEALYRAKSAGRDRIETGD